MQKRPLRCQVLEPSDGAKGVFTPVVAAGVQHPASEDSVVTMRTGARRLADDVFDTLRARAVSTAGGRDDEEAAASETVGVGVPAGGGGTTEAGAEAGGAADAGAAADGGIKC